MSVYINTNFNRSLTSSTKPKATASTTTKPQADAASQRARSTPVPDEVTISPQAQAKATMAQAQGQVISTAMQAAQAVTDNTEPNDNTTTFSSFADEFAKLTEEYTETIRQYYAQAHEENLTFDDPAKHVWDKYKNESSPYFRVCMSEDERAWAYDQEIDMLQGGKHLQLSNPYAFAVGNPPTLEDTAQQANMACREQIDQSVQAILKDSGIELSDDVTFRLAVNSDYSIQVLDMENQEQASALEQALNHGDNGKNLYHHLKVTAPDQETISIAYSNGHLETSDPQQALSDQNMEEVKQQVGSTYGRYSTTYNPHQQPLNDQILSLHSHPEHTQEYTDRLSATVRVAAPELVADFRAHKSEQQLPVDPVYHEEIDISDLLKTYMQAYAQPAQDAKATIESYYAAAHTENSAYSLSDGLNHIADKYLRSDSGIFRTDLPEAQRAMAYRQERALLTGARVTLNAPYALAAIGGVQNAKDSHQAAIQAVLSQINELQSQKYGVNQSKNINANAGTNASIDVKA